MPERMAYAIDDSRWPLVVSRATEFIDDPEAAEVSYERLEAILARRQRFVLIFDMRGATSTPARRRKFLEWCARHSDALTRYLVAGAVIASSSIERGFATATLWVRTPPWPTRVFGDPQEAEEWLMGMMG